MSASVTARALRLLAEQIQSPDDIPELCLRDAALELESLTAENAQLREQGKEAAALCVRYAKELGLAEGKLAGVQMQNEELRSQIEAAKSALGEHPDSEVDLAQRISELRDEARAAFHSHTQLLFEREKRCAVSDASLSE